MVDVFQFLASLHLMDYSLIVGIHDCERADSDAIDALVQEEPGGEEVYDENDAENGLLEDDEYDYGGVPTPPDSPQPLVTPPFGGELDSNLERFGIKSSDGM